MINPALHFTLQIDSLI